MKQLTALLTLAGLSFLTACSVSHNKKGDTTPLSGSKFNISIPVAGNAWIMESGAYVESEMLSPEGIRHWSNPKHTVRTFFYLEKAGNIALGIRAGANAGKSTIRVTFRQVSKNVTLESSALTDTYVADFQVEQPGYYFVDITGLEKDGAEYADLQEVLLGGVQARDVKYAKDDFYFARRGPSVHLNFQIPAGVDRVEWFYSEITIPEHQDVVGSYFMADGFGEGYFGIQVNSPTERRILFSIWSPYQTDNPAEIPEEYKIKLLRKGAGVSTGEFGNEGSGGQSFKVFPWKTGVNYGFLVGAKPTGDGSTDYIAYFHDPATEKWNLIAQFRRPKTTTYLRDLYSFLENFIPEQGVYERRGLYHNQWVYNAAGWHELTKAGFTADNTAMKAYRLDYSGGVENDAFYLKNCGFSDDRVPVNTKFERKGGQPAPKIDFKALK